jgi:protein PhnA
MSELPPCPKCQSTFVYEAGVLLICPQCGYEWSNDVTDNDAAVIDKKVYDANGAELQDGDTITVIKNLKVKGSSAVVKAGTKVKNIKLVDGDHDIDCKIPGIGAMGLKSEFVKKI